MGAPDAASTTEKGGRGSDVPWWRQRCVQVLLMCLAALLVILIIVTTTLSSGCTCETVSETTETVPLSTYTEVTTQISYEPEFTLPDGRPIVRRSEWSTVPPDFRRQLHHPTPYVVIGHTAGPACTNKSHCFSLLRVYQEEHRARWAQPDISYNFLIDVSGNVYEGRGWDATNNYKSWALRCNLAVTLLGNFQSDNVTSAMARSLQQLLDLGVSLGKLDAQYRLVAQNQLMGTISPGTYALEAISTWPHRCLGRCDEGVQCGLQDTDQLLV